MFATPYMCINYTAGHNDFFVTGRDGIYRQTIKVRWKCRHSSAFKKGCWIEGNKISKCLVTLCIARSLLGSMGREGKGNVSFQRGSGNLAVWAILLVHHEKSFPPSVRKEILRLQVLIVQHLVMIQLNVPRSMGWIHPFTCSWAAGKQRCHYLSSLQWETWRETTGHITTPLKQMRKFLFR